MKKSCLLLLVTAAVFTMFCNVCLHSQESAWTKLATLKDAPPFGLLAAANGKLYVVSGTTSANSPTYEYDPDTDTWTTKAPIPQGCYWATATVVNDEIIVMGGRIPQKPQNFNYIYNPQSNTWAIGADLLTPRNYHSAVAANGKVYLMGGQNGDGTTEWYFDEYDPSTDSWARKAQMAHNGAWYCAAGELNGKVYRIAGGGATPTLTRDHFDEYDPSTDTWTSLPNFNVKLHAPSCVTYNNKIYIMGGTTSGIDIDTVYVYSGSGAWTISSIKLPQPRTYHKTAILGDCVYLYGGQNGSEEFDGQLYRYCFERQDVDYEAPAEAPVVVPNPTQGDFTVTLAGEPCTDINVSVTGMLGQPVGFHYSAFGNSFSISLEERIPGMYFVRVQNGSRVHCEKVLVSQ